MIIETSERCICLNENCGNEVIHAHRTTRHVDETSGVLTVKACCQNCRTLYIAKRHPMDGIWGPPQIEIITDRDRIEAFERTINAIGEIQRKDLPPVRAA